MSYGKKLYKSNLTAFDAENVYDSTIGKLQNEINADQIVSLNDKVSKAGDTMTGELTVQNSAISAKSTTADTTDDAPESYTYWDIKHTDKNNSVAAYWETSYSTSGTSETTFRARRNVNGSNVNNGFKLSVNKNGERFVLFDEPVVWRTALNAVNKSGDTMTGTLKNKTSLIDVTASAPSSSLFPAHHLIVDKNDKTIGGLYGTYNTIGNLGIAVGSQRTVNGSIVYNWLSLLVDPNGKQAVSVSNASVWREALGFGTNGAFPITIAQGGTGSTAVASTSTISQIVTAETGFTFSSPSFLQWGKIGVFRIGITKNVSWSGAQNPGTVVSGRRTITQCALVCYTSPYITGMLDPNGTITINSATTINANVTHYFYAIYFLA